LKIDPEFEQRVIAECLRSGQPIPDKFANPPELPVGTEFYFDSFFELSTERSIGFGEGPIPITSILQYARYHDLDDSLEYELIFFVRQLDFHYLQYQASKQPK